MAVMGNGVALTTAVFESHRCCGDARQFNVDFRALRVRKHSCSSDDLDIVNDTCSMMHWKLKYCEQNDCRWQTRNLISAESPSKSSLANANNAATTGSHCCRISQCRSQHLPRSANSSHCL